MSVSLKKEIYNRQDTYQYRLPLYGVTCDGCNTNVSNR